MKTTISMVAAFSVVFALSAPSARGAGLDADPTGAQVTYWYQHSQDREVAMRRLIDQFNATNPWKIKVTGEYSGPYATIYDKMIAAIAAGNPPELVVAYQNQAAGYEVSKALVDLNPYVNDPKYGISSADLKDFVEGFITQDVSSQFGGMRLGFPPNRSVEVMYYNAAWLNKIGMSDPPQTWDRFYAAAKAATRTEAGTYGYAIDTDASRVFAQVVSRGGGIVSADGKGYVFTGPAMKESMAFMQRLYREGLGRKLAKAGDDQTDFANAMVLFTIGSTSGMPFYTQAVNAGKGGAFDWSVAALPHTTARPTLNLYGASVSIPKTTAQKQLAAWLFIRWFSEPKQQAAWTMVSNYFPVRKSAAALLTDYMAKDRRFAKAWDLLSASDLKAEPPFAGYDLVRDAVSRAYNAILDGADIDSTLVRLEADANKIYRDSAP
ncbi:MAG TPA: extracellular solute-binding protein [Spirochaetia bacterium]|nr:extracellular solute-binding protein [Spirochaetia bacterium]